MNDRHYRGLEKAIDEMPDADLGNGFYIELHYNLDEDEVYTHKHVSLGYNHWTEYDDPHIVRIGFFAHKVLKEEIIKYIDDEIAFASAIKDKERNGMAAENADILINARRLEKQTLTQFNVSRSVIEQQTQRQR